MNVLPSRRDFLAWSLLAAGASRIPLQAQAAKITTIAGTGMAGTAPDGGDALSVPINNPYGLVIGPDKKVYWADFGSNRVLSLNLETKKIGVVAGKAQAGGAAERGNVAGGYSGDGGPATAATLRAPHEVRFDSKGDLYVAERDNHVVRKVDMKTGTISTFAGTGARGFSGDGGPAAMAQLAQPHSIALDKADNVYICDIVNNRVRKVDAKTGVITTFAGTGAATATPDAAEIAGTPTRGPRSIEVAPDGTMYLILREGNAVFAIDPEAGRLKRLAGTGELGYAGDGGPAISARFGAPGNALNGPKGIGYSADSALYVVDTENHAIRKIDLRSGIITTVVGTGQRGDGPDGTPATCKLSRPHGVFVIGRKIYIGDSENHRIRLLET